MFTQIFNYMYKKIFNLKLLGIILLFFFSLVAKANDTYYLSSEGYLINIDLNNFTEKGKVIAGSMPTSIASCGNHIYFTDFSTDKLYDYDITEKKINNIDLQSLNSSDNEIKIYKEEDKIHKTPLRKAFESIIKPKKVKKENVFNDVEEPLAISIHNKKLGLTSVACNDKYIFISNTLKGKVNIVDRKKLTIINSFDTGERPTGLSISPNGDYLAICSTALDKVFIVNATGNFSVKNEFETEEGPTDSIWLDNSNLAIINRGSSSLSLINTNTKIINSIAISSPVNAILKDKNNNLYALSGVDNKIFEIKAGNLTANLFLELKENMDFPSILFDFDQSDKMLIGSEKDKKLIILNLKDKTIEKRIKTNFSPKVFIKNEV